MNNDECDRIVPPGERGDEDFDPILAALDAIIREREEDEWWDAFEAQLDADFPPPPLGRPQSAP